MMNHFIIHIHDIKLHLKTTYDNDKPHGPDKTGVEPDKSNIVVPIIFPIFHKVLEKLYIVVRLFNCLIECNSHLLGSVMWVKPYSCTRD